MSFPIVVLWNGLHALHRIYAREISCVADDDKKQRLEDGLLMGHAQG